MKIYFSCSITGGRSEERIYQALVEEMLALGHEVPTAHLSGSNVMELEDAEEPTAIYERDMNWLRQCDAVVAEVTSPSHGVGYEIAVGILLNKPVLCCYQQGRRVTKMLTGNTSPNLTLKDYGTVDQARTAVRDYLNGLGQANR